MSKQQSSRKRDRDDSGNGEEGAGNSSGDKSKKAAPDAVEKPKGQKQVDWKVNLYPSEAAELDTMGELLSMSRRQLVLHLMPEQTGEKQPEEDQKQVQWKLKFYPNEVQKLETMRSLLSMNRRQLLLHFLRLNKGNHHSTPAKEAGHEPEARAAQRLPSPIPREGGAGAEMPQRRIPIPIYAGAAAALAEDMEWDLNDEDVYEYDEHDSFQLNVQPRRGPADADSFDLSDRQGQRLRSPSPVDENSPEQKARRALEAKWKEQEPMEYDYSDSTRLLPPGYFHEFSEGRKVRLHVPKTPIISKEGLLIKPPKGKKRTEIQNTLNAIDVVKDGRYIVEFHQLLKLLPSKCYVSKCDAQNNLDPETVKRGIRRVGGVLEISIKCCGHPSCFNEIHEFKWASSRKLVHFDDPKSQPYTLNVLVPSAIVVSGNQFSGMDFFFKTMNIRTTQVRQFLRVQKFLIAPVIEQAWRIEQRIITDNIRANNFRVISAGDGQYDSPGYSATYCTYIQMAVGLERDNPDKSVYSEKTAYVLDVTLTEKRHTEYSSGKMEVAGFLRSMLSLRALNIPISEVVTDQHTKILELMKNSRRNPHQFLQDAKEALSSFPDIDASMLNQLLLMCRGVSHKLDIWHRTKNMGEALEKKKVGWERSKCLLPWVKSIKNHFWFAARTCNGDVDQMARIWTSATHHIQGEHVWNGGTCDHDTLDPPEERPPDLAPDSETFKAIVEVLLNPELLQKLHYYVTFRHTGVLESFNALTLAYVMKLIFYFFHAMLMRKLVAAMDQNDAVHRRVKRDHGKLVLRKVYSKKSGQWVLRPEKEKKRYSHVPHLMAMILSEACNSPFRLNDRHKDHVPEIPNDPKKLGPNTAPKQADQKDVERRYKTRYGPGYFAAIPDDDPDEEGEEVGLDLGDQGIDPEIDWAEDESGEEEEDFQYRVRLDEGKLRFSRRYEDNAYRVTAEEGLRLKISRKGKEGDGQ